jgi:hypothetical protein
MKNQTIAPLLWLALSMAVLSFSACGTKIEAQKTTVIEREAESPSGVSVSITGKKKGSHLRISGGE